jgi:hypothetical protein
MIYIWSVKNNLLKSSKREDLRSLEKVEQDSIAQTKMIKKARFKRKQTSSTCRGIARKST